MSFKKVLAYAMLCVGVFLLVKIYVDGTHRNTPEVPPEVKEITLDRLPMGYSLGLFDERFGITRERFLQIVDEAKRVWENAAGKSLFEYRKSAPLKVNLVFDWRQEQLLAAKERRAKIDESGKSFDQLRAEYEERSRSVERLRQAYEDSAQVYRNRMEEFNARAKHWNDGENRNETEYQYLQNRKKELEDEQDAVEKARLLLKTNVEELSALGENLNALVRKHNLEVENFNGQYIEKREFEKGIFDGRAINIYEYEKEDDLRLAIVHEFGHALGLEHVDNPRSIMYRKLAVQDLQDIHLTSEDLTALQAKLRR